MFSIYMGLHPFRRADLIDLRFGPFLFLVSLTIESSIHTGGFQEQVSIA